MYLQGQILRKQIFIVALMVWLAVCALAAYGQQTTNSAPAAQPVLPESSADSAKASDKDVAKATELPATDTPASRVGNVRPDTYIIGVDDGLAINVWKEPELSKGPITVRPDGMITIPLVGEIKAVGLTPTQLQDQITASLQKVMSDPQVSVIVVSVNSLSFNIMGQVAKPGYYPITRHITVLDAIAMAGGFRDFAKQKKIYVLRTAPDGKEQRLKFNYKEVIKGKNMAQNITLLPHDTLVIP